MSPDPATRSPHPPITPHLVVDGAAKAIEFYRRAFGAQELFRHDTPDGKRILHASFLINGGMVMINDDFPEMCGGKSQTPRAFGGTPVTLHLNLPDVDAAWKQAVEAGATVVEPLADQFWGDRYGIVEDPFGHRWSMATRVREVSPEEMKEMAAQFFAG